MVDRSSPQTGGSADVITEDAWETILGAAKDKRYRWLKNHHLFASSLARMLGGWSMWRLAGWMQDRVDKDDPLHISNVKREALMHRLNRFRRRLPKTLFLPRAYLDELIEKAEADVDVLAELNALIAYQKQRIDLLRSRETEMGMPIEQQRKEIQTLLDLLMRARDTQISLGVTPGMLIPQIGPIHDDGTHEDRVGDTRLEIYIRDHPEDVAEFMRLLDQLPIGGEDGTQRAEDLQADGRPVVPGLPDHGGGGDPLRADREDPGVGGDEGAGEALGPPHPAGPE